MSLAPNPAARRGRRIRSRTGWTNLTMIGGTAALLVVAGCGGTETSASDSDSTVAPTTDAPMTTEQRNEPPPTTLPPTTLPPTTLPPTTLPPTTPPPTTQPPTTLPPTTPPPTAPPVSYTVIAVVDGDTVDVAPSDGSAGLRVRLIGIDAPESGACEAAAATWTLAGLVQDHMVVLTPGGDGEDTDRYGRFLRYVDVDGVDAGLRLIENGVAVARYDSRDGYGAHTRESTYVAADNATPPHTCPPPTTQPPPPPTTQPRPPTTQPPPPPTTQPRPPTTQPRPPTPSGCDPNYTGCVPIDSDVDCAGGSGNGPSYAQGPVRVIGQDIYGLDGNDNDGIGCE